MNKGKRRMKKNAPKKIIWVIIKDKVFIGNFWRCTDLAYRSGVYVCMLTKKCYITISPNILQRELSLTIQCTVW